MNLESKLYWYLVDWLTNRPVVYPQHVVLPFEDQFKPSHLDCYGTARTVCAQFGHPVIAGIKFLDKAGKLFPWPHMINATDRTVANGLIDASPVPMETDLGFIAVRLNETEWWNQITGAYAAATSEEALGQSWGCSLADSLTDQFFNTLKMRASCARWPVQTICIPPTMPKVEECSK